MKKLAVALLLSLVLSLGAQTPTLGEKDAELLEKLQLRRALADANFNRAIAEAQNFMRDRNDLDARIKVELDRVFKQAGVSQQEYGLDLAARAFVKREPPATNPVPPSPQ